MIRFTPSIGFTGQCAGAIELYKKAFGAKVIEKVLFSAPVAKENGYKCKSGEEDYIYYCELLVGEQVFTMADDSMDILDKENPGNTRRLGLLMHFDCADELKAACELLADGGKVLAPIHSTTYCSAYVVVEDKFGIGWELMSGYEG
ncbi:MAG: VOC family protein [Oscillospiraceae bacterium]|nr:VOC family protein [Oscillospiraceae bacterium]